MQATWMAKLLFLLSAILVGLQPLNGEDLAGDSQSPSSRLRQSPGASSYTNRSGISTRMSHKFHPGSPFLPAGCDRDCAFNMTLESNAKSMAHRRRRLASGGRLPITSNFQRTSLAGDWYVTLKVGQPMSGNWADSQEVQLHVDSGSSFTWFQCSPCQNCYPQKLSVFDPAKSTSFKYLTGSDNYCNVMQNSNMGNGASPQECKYKLAYADGDYSHGDVALEYMLFDPITNGDLGEVFMGLGFGCGRDNKNVLKDGPGGVLGLGSIEGVGISILDQLAGNIGQGFSYCLGELYSNPQQGWLLLGSESIPDNFVWTPFLTGKRGKERDFYVDLVDIYLGNIPLGCPPNMFDIQDNGQGGVTIDSGTTFTYLATQAYVLWRDAWKAAMAGQLGPSFAYGSLEVCWVFAGDPKTLKFPIISLYFRNGIFWTFDLATSYVMFTRRSGQSVMCLPLLEEKGSTPYDPNIMSVIGGFHQVHTHMIYDTTNRRLGWLYQRC